MKKSIVCMALASAGLWMSCSTTEKVTEKDLTGNWIEVMPVNQHIVQGVSLYEKVRRLLSGWLRCNISTGG